MTWLILALVAYGLMGSCLYWALMPKAKMLSNPDWFWTGGAWVLKPEPTDRRESKPTSAAG